MTDTEKVFRYKLDFYYQSALIYVGTLILYGGIRGSFVEKRFSYVLDDPIVYMILAFVLISIISLALNLLRNRKLLTGPDWFTFSHRWHMRIIRAPQIEWMHIGREPRVQTGGRFQVIVVKLKGRRRLLRIRVGRYEREKELEAEMTRIASMVPNKKPRRWPAPRFTDN